MAIAAGSALLPGLAHWVAGRRRAAVTIASLALVLLVSLAALAASTSRLELLRLAVRPGWLAFVIAAALVVALAWVVLVTGSYRVLGPVRTTGLAQVGVVLTLAVLSLLVAAPPVAVARYAYLQRDLITNLFPDDPNGGLAAGEGGSGNSNPFAGRDRVTILLLASDAGPDRTGVRTDSIVAASIDTHTGDVVLLSLPRNLQEVPMPPGPLREQWPDGFPDLLNERLPELVLAAGAAGRRPGPGRRGHQAGGLVHPRHPHRLLRDGRPGRLLPVHQRDGRGDGDGHRAAADRRRCRRTAPACRRCGYIEPGTQRLGGEKALWYARSRRDSSDYDRMIRQRCLIGAMVRQAEPLTVLKHFQELASATKKLAETDIPRSVLPDLITLGDKMHGGSSIRSVAFVPPVIVHRQPATTPGSGRW